MNVSESVKPNRHDLILVSVILAAAAAAALVLHIQNEQKAGTVIAAVTAKVDGEVYGTWDLDEDQSISIDTEYGHNVLVIRDGEAYMAEADCPDGYCMSQSPISAEHPERTIVCLPHRLVVSGDDAYDQSGSQTVQNSGVDAIAG